MRGRTLLSRSSKPQEDIPMSPKEIQELINSQIDALFEAAVNGSTELAGQTLTGVAEMLEARDSQFE
ncbi:MAG: hypothetical protein CMJ32_03110 [Phycisphaerae bacterium]|nr:hypothetical protein [Phycisphaerae bacterium]